MNKQMIKQFLDIYKSNKWLKLFISFTIITIIAVVIVYASAYIEAEVLKFGVYGSNYDPSNGYGSDDNFSTGMTIQILLIFIAVLIMIKYNLSDMLKHITGIFQTLIIFIIAMSLSLYVGTFNQTVPHLFLKILNLFLWTYFALGMSYHMISLIRIMVKDED